MRRSYPPLPQVPRKPYCFACVACHAANRPQNVVPLRTLAVLSARSFGWPSCFADALTPFSRASSERAVSVFGSVAARYILMAWSYCTCIVITLASPLPLQASSVRALRHPWPLAEPTFGYLQVPHRLARRALIFYFYFGRPSTRSCAYLQQVGRADTTVCLQFRAASDDAADRPSASVQYLFISNSRPILCVRLRY